MNPEVRYEESDGTYQLGATIDGVFVPFTAVQATYVEGLKTAAATAAEASQTQTGAGTATAPPPAAEPAAGEQPRAEQAPEQPTPPPVP